MPILKFLWLGIRPIGKLESALGMWDVFHLALWIAYPTIGIALPLEKVFEGASTAWFAGIPIVLLLIAGIKLQFRLARIENAYHYALSFEELDVDQKYKVLMLSMKFSNALDKPIEYELIANRTYIEIEGSQRVVLQSNDRGIIAALRSVMVSLPKITLPEVCPCSGILHYELVYGRPNKPSFKQVREYELEIDRGYQNAKLGIYVNTESKLLEDNPIKK